MKTLFSIIAMVVLMGTATFAQTSNVNDNVAIAAARTVLQADCIAGTGDINTTVYHATDGNYYVYFYHTYRCQPNTICPMYFRIAPIARVVVDSEFNVVSYSCGFMVADLAM